VFDYGNSIRDEARKAGSPRFDFPGFAPPTSGHSSKRPRPFRWAALSGDPKDIAATDRAILELFPDNKHLARWIEMAGEKVEFQGAARICWLGYGERHLAGLKFNEMVASGELAAPIVIGRDHLDSGSVGLAVSETEAMLDAPMRSPTGPCSMRWSTRRPARRGCRFTTAAESGWAAPFTPAR